MRVVAYITEGHRELIEELEHVPAKQRAERFRLLASIGLLTLRSAWSPFAGSGADKGERTLVEPTGNSPFETRRTGLRNKLQSSLNDKR